MVVGWTPFFEEKKKGEVKDTLTVKPANQNAPFFLFVIYIFLILFGEYLFKFLKEKATKEREEAYMRLRSI